MRIAIVAPGEIFGGAERQILTLISGLIAETGFAPDLLVFYEGELAKRARDHGAQVYVNGDGSLFDLVALRAMRRIFTTRHYDVVSVHGYRATTYLALAGLPRDTAVLKTEHGRMESWGGSLKERLKARLYRAIENRATRRLRATCVYVTRDLESQVAGEHTGLAQRVIYNGIEAPSRADTRRPAEYRTDRLNLVMVGRLERVKAADLAIRSLASGDMPPHAVLNLVGAGPELDSLRTLAGELGVAARVQFLGFQSNVFDYIAHADALLLPSRHEGLPYTMLEALALGTPVIAARVGGLGEVLRSRDNSLLIEPESPAAIAQAVLTLTREPQLREQLIAAGMRMVREQFSASAMTRGYLDAAGASGASNSS